MHRLNILPQTKKRGKRRSFDWDWRPRTPEEIVRQKNRKVINQHLKRIGKVAGHDLSLDHNGTCCVSFKKFVLVCEVPESNSSVCVFHSKVCHLGPFDNLEEIHKFVTLYNHRQASISQDLTDASSASECTCPAVDPHTRGTRLAVRDEEEVSLCLTFPIQGLSFEDTAAKMEFFIKSAVAVNRKLEKAKSLPLRIPEPTILQEDAPPSPGGSAIARRVRFWSSDSQTSVSTMSQCSIFSLFSPKLSSSEFPH